MRSKHVSVTVVIVENSAGRDATVGDDEVTPRSRLTTEKSLAPITHLDWTHPAGSRPNKSPCPSILSIPALPVPSTISAYRRGTPTTVSCYSDPLSSVSRRRLRTTPAKRRQPPGVGRSHCHLLGPGLPSQTPHVSPNYVPLTQIWANHHCRTPVPLTGYTSAWSNCLALRAREICILSLGTFAFRDFLPIAKGKLRSAARPTLPYTNERTNATQEPLLLRLHRQTNLTFTPPTEPTFTLPAPIPLQHGAISKHISPPESQRRQYLREGRLIMAGDNEEHEVSRSCRQSACCPKDQGGVN